MSDEVEEGALAGWLERRAVCRPWAVPTEKDVRGIRATLQKSCAAATDEFSVR